MPNITEIAPSKLTGWIRPCYAEMSGLSYIAIRIQSLFKKLSPSPTTVQNIFQM